MFDGKGLGLFEGFTGHGGGAGFGSGGTEIKREVVNGVGGCRLKLISDSLSAGRAREFAGCEREILDLVVGQDKLGAEVLAADRLGRVAQGVKIGAERVGGQGRFAQ